jgi:Fe2+ transport system protein B
VVSNIKVKYFLNRVAIVLMITVLLVPFISSITATHANTESSTQTELRQETSGGGGAEIEREEEQEKYGSRRTYWEKYYKRLADRYQQDINTLSERLQAPIYTYQGKEGQDKKSITLLLEPWLTEGTHIKNVTLKEFSRNSQTFTATVRGEPVEIRYVRKEDGIYAEVIRLQNINVSKNNKNIIDLADTRNKQTLSFVLPIIPLSEILLRSLLQRLKDSH